MSVPDRPLSIGDGIAMAVGFVLVFLLNPLGWVAMLIIAALVRWVNS